MGRGQAFPIDGLVDSTIDEDAIAVLPPYWGLRLGDVPCKVTGEGEDRCASDGTGDGVCVGPNGGKPPARPVILKFAIPPKP